MNPLVVQAHSCMKLEDSNSNCGRDLCVNYHVSNPQIRGIANPNHEIIKHTVNIRRTPRLYHQIGAPELAAVITFNVRKQGSSNYGTYHHYCKKSMDSVLEVSAKALPKGNFNADDVTAVNGYTNHRSTNRGLLTAGPGHRNAVTESASSVAVSEGGEGDGGKSSRGLVEWEGSVLLEKQNFLDLSNIVADIRDKFSELFGSRVFLQLVSSTCIDPDSKEGKRSEKAYLEDWFQTRSTLRADEGTSYKVRFKVDEQFGTPGAILVENQHPSPFLLRSISLNNNTSAPINFTCNTWIYKTTLSAGSRIFFLDQCYLPIETPSGIRKLRQAELENKRGDGSGERVTSDRVYDYAVYNDLGNPDKGAEYARPVLGGSEDFPYPRRCRTGRASTKADPGAEKPLNIVGNVYVPRDEQFGREKTSDFFGSILKSILHVVLPTLRMLLSFSRDYQSYDQVYGLYSKDSIKTFRDNINPPSPPDDLSDTSQRPLELFRQLTDPRGGDTGIFRFPVPQIIQVNEAVWCDDAEFARQLLVGVNPFVIQRLKVFPPTSNLDPNLYGTTQSALTAEHIEGGLEGLTVDEALRENRLYIVDYHDVYLPFIERINNFKGKGYATRSIFFLTSKGILDTLAIELSLPAYDGKPATKQVFVPPTNLPRNRDPLWELAKLHATINDTGYHELVTHWLRSHASVEPFIIATHRQLSTMHPIYHLLIPHFKNTMNINATARNDLINSFSGSLVNGGIIEYGFTPGRYSMEMSSAVYKQWRFDEQALPIDLIKRGMAERDPTKKHGLRLLIEDYPFAVDALDIWSALSGWAEDYVNIFYADDGSVAHDTELQDWWSEVRLKGHADKANEEGWPKLEGRAELANVLTTIMWLASGHHAGVNFGQYGYGGFPPSRATKGRLLLPEKDTEEYRELMKNPNKFYLKTMTPVFQSLLVIATLEILSNHAINEEYLGQDAAYESVVASSSSVRIALAKFQERLREAEREIEMRNQDPTLENRCGKAAILYTIMMPSSPNPGLSGRGIPNSISI